MRGTALAADKHKKDTVTEADLQLAYSCWRSPNKDQEFGRKMYTFHVLVEASPIILDRIEYVTYKLPPAWEANQIKTIGKEGRSTCFEMKELAWGASTINADVKIEGQDKLVALSHPIILTKTGPRLPCASPAPPVLDDPLLPTYIETDRWTTTDKLNYEIYAIAIAHFLTRPETRTPLFNMKINIGSTQHFINAEASSSVIYVVYLVTVFLLAT